MKKRKILILGGAGFIGSAIVKLMVEKRSYDITIGDSFTNNSNKNDSFFSYLNDNKIKLINEDFTDSSQFKKLDNDYDDFYMLASMIGVNNTLKNPHEVIRVNTALIYNSLEWLKKTKIKNVLFTSTSECYSGTIDKFNYKIPTPEEIPLCIDPIDHPRFTYAVTKMLGESGFLNYSRIYNFNCKIIRYNNVFGPNMGFGHVIPHLVERFLKKENPFKIYGGNQTRSFCYIDDGALGTIQAMECKEAKRDIFHIGSENEILIKDLIFETGNYFDFNGEYIMAPTYPGSVSRRCPDISKSKKMFGYEPKVNWKKGLIKTLDWYKKYFLKYKGSYFKGPSEIYSL